MMKLKPVFLSIVSMCILEAALAQDFSQDWGNYITNLNKPLQNPGSARVDEFSGAINYQVPICELGGIFPVSLGYSSTGVKVDEYASAVGLGWNLNAGGSIVKMVKGLDDEETYGYPFNYQFNPINNAAQYQGTLDAEKDYYQFNAFGFSGMFYSLDKGVTFIPTAYHHISITKVNAGTPQEMFIIKDMSGNTYEFGKYEETHVFNKDETNINATPVLSASFKTGWMLTKVITASGQQVVLTYQNKLTTLLKTGVSEAELREIEMKTPCGPGTWVAERSARSVFNTIIGHRLTSVTYLDEQVNILYDNAHRSDIEDDEALVGFEVLKKGHLVSHFELEHQYMSGRLMFTQFNKKSNNSINKQALLTFEYYNDYTMPQPASCKSQDGFGYFNNAPVYNYDDADWDAPSNTAGPASLLPAVLFHQPSNENNINGANRAIAQVEVTQTLMLKKVTDLYGKMEEFVYARNNFHAEPNPVVRHEEVIHGLRVFQLIQYDQTQPAQKKYSRYDYLDEDGFSSGVKIRAWTDGKWFYVHGGSCPLIFRSANISSKKTIILNQILAYSRVKITRFTDPNNIATSTIGSVINTYTTDVTIPINNNPQNPYLARPNRWGDLLSTTQYNKNNQVIQKTLYTYVYWPGSGFQCSYTFLTGKTSAGLSSVYSSYDYTFYMDRKALSTVEQFNYNAQAELLGTEKTTFHHDGYQQVVKEEKEVNGVLKGATYYKYPYDYSIIATTSNNNAAAILKMVEKKMESTVVEQINTQYENNVELVTSAGFTLFKHNQINNLVLPDKVLAHKMVSPIAINGYNGLSFHTTTGNPTYNNNFELKTELTKYDELNLLVESKNKGQLPSAIYNNLGGETYFSVSGATVNQMGYMGLEEDEMNRLDQLGHIAGKITLVLPCPTSNPLSTDAFSGSKSFNAGICPGAAIRFATLPDGRTYKLRYWIKNGTASFAGSAIVVGASKVLRTIGNWELREHVLTGSGALLVGGTGLIDDVLVYPVGSAYSYNVFNQTGDISCECDETGNCTFYEYDDYNRLTTIRNIDKQILKRVEYSIQHLH